MSAPFQRYDPDQPLLFPPDLREWLPAGHVAYFVMDVVGEGLDLGEIYRHYDIETTRDEQGKVLEERVKTNRGRPAYDPRMMTALLLYGYVTGVPSSRKIEQKCEEDVAFRVISANRKPDHATIAEFRNVHLKALRGLFVQVLQLCQEAKLARLGHVSLDGTKVKANASKHKAMSYGHMAKRKEELEAEVADLLRQAKEADRVEDLKYGKGRRGDELPEELQRRETRLAKIGAAMAAVVAKAKAEAERIRTEDEEERKRREREGESPKGGRRPDPPETPKDKAQRNFTDAESRIMRNSDKAFIQGYNAQAVVDAGHQVIVACDVTDQAVDVQQLGPMVEAVKANTGEVPKALSADAGYFSEENVRVLEENGLDPLIAAERLTHSEKPPSARGRIPKDLSMKERMRRKLRTLAGRALYALRKITVEPVFGQIRTRGLLRFWLRGLEKVRAEWALWCLGHNLLKLFRSGRFVPAAT